MKRVLFILTFLTLLVESAFPFCYFRTIDGKRIFGTIKEDMPGFYLVELIDENQIVKIRKDDLVLVEMDTSGITIFKQEYISPVNINNTKSPLLCKRK